MQCFITRWSTEKRVENTTCNRVFLMNFEVFHLVMKHCVECLILLLKQNGFRRRNLFLYELLMSLRSSCNAWIRWYLLIVPHPPPLEHLHNLFWRRRYIVIWSLKYLQILFFFALFYQQFLLLSHRWGMINQKVQPVMKNPLI